MIICSPQLGIAPGSGLGGEVYDREILKQLDSLGVTLLIILPWGKPIPKFKKAKIYRLPLPFVAPPWIFNLLIIPYLFILQSKYHFTILRVHSPYFVGLGAWFFRVFYRSVKIIPSYLHLEENNKLYSVVDRFLLPRVGAITTISEATKHDLIKTYDIDSKKITVIPCGVDKKYRPVSKNPKLVDKYGLKDKKVLLYLGQLVARKNVSFLFGVIKGLPDKYVLLIAGSGERENSLKEQVTRLHLESRVIFTGYVLEEEKVDFYNLADIFLYPSKKEGFGMSVWEAVACGINVVVPPLAVYKESKNSAIVQTPLSSAQWVKSIKKINTKRFSPKLQFSWEKSGKKYYEFLKRQSQ